MALLDIIKARHSIRKYTDEQISRTVNRENRGGS